MRGKHIDMCGASNRKRTGVRGVLLKVRVQIFVYRARGRWFLQVVTPGNVDKSKGVRLELDGQYVKTIPIIKCDTHDPCRAQIPFTASLRKRFSGAKTATIEFAAEKKPRFEMTVKLNGLAEAMEAAVRR
jgi:invasion protein IalB